MSNVRNPCGMPLYKNKIFPLIRSNRRSKDISKWPYEEFHKLISENISDILKSVDSRWLLSICDTYVIQTHDPRMASNALFIVGFFTCLRLWGTDTYFSNISVDPRNQEMNSNPLWDGFYTYIVGGGDTITNLYKRARKILNSYEPSKKVLTPIFNHLTKKAVEPGKHNVFRRALLTKSKNIQGGVAL